MFFPLTMRASVTVKSILISQSSWRLSLSFLNFSFWSSPWHECTVRLFSSASLHNFDIFLFFSRKRSKPRHLIKSVHSFVFSVRLSFPLKRILLIHYFNFKSSSLNFWFVVWLFSGLYYLGCFPEQSLLSFTDSYGSIIPCHHHILIAC